MGSSNNSVPSPSESIHLAIPHGEFEPRTKRLCPNDLAIPHGEFEHDRYPTQSGPKISAIPHGEFERLRSRRLSSRVKLAIPHGEFEPRWTSVARRRAGSRDPSWGVRTRRPDEAVSQQARDPSWGVRTPTLADQLRLELAIPHGEFEPGDYLRLHARRPRDPSWGVRTRRVRPIAWLFANSRSLMGSSNLRGFRPRRREAGLAIPHGEFELTPFGAACGELNSRSLMGSSNTRRWARGSSDGPRDPSWGVRTLPRQSWPRKTGQGVKWIFCLTAA